MKTITLHGDNEPKLNERLVKYIEHAKKKSWQIDRFNQENKLIFAEYLSSGNLFEQDRLFIVDEANRLTSKDLTWLEKNNSSLSGYLILVYSGLLNEKIKKSLPKDTKYEEFKLPRLIFNFLDAFYPGNVTNVLKLLKEIEKNEPIEFIFSLLSRHIRDLYWIGFAGEPYPYAESWRIGKIKSQARKFKESKLKKIINLLSKADMLSKSSNEELSDLLDQIIITSLE
jgi:DNA polymerase III delta subunit